MIFTLGVVILIVGTLLVYRAAKSSGRSTVLWSALSLVVGISFQLVIPFVTMLFVAVFYISDGTGSLPDEYQIETLSTYSIVAQRAGILLSFGAMFLIRRLASSLPDSGPVSQVPPPPPPEFGDNI